MTITTLSSRQFSQDASKAKRAAEAGPVVITDRGRPAHVLLTFKDYERLTKSPKKISELLAMPGVEDIEIDFPRMDDFPREIDLS